MSSSSPGSNNGKQTKLCLVRHGETDWNAERRLQGLIDIPLNELGLRQAKAVATVLASTKPDPAFSAIYCSDLQRARVTAEIIAQQLDLSVNPVAGLRERNFGVLQGLTQDEANERYPDVHGRNRVRDANFVPPNGESLQAFADKIKSELVVLAKRHVGQSILVVSHGGVMDAAYRIATGMPLSAPRSFTLGNATLNWLGFKVAPTENGEHSWRLISWDGRDHLARSDDELPL